MTEEKKGEMFGLGRTFIWAFFPIVTILSLGKLPSLLALAWTTLFAGIFFLVLVAYKNLWHELKNFLLWKYVFMIVIFIGVLFYGFFFAGLELTTAGNGSIIALFEIFTAFVFFHLIRKEYMSNDNKLGALLMVLGAIIVLAPNFHQINKGDFLILIAVFFPPIGNLYQQKAKKLASSVTVLFLRSLMSVPILFLLAYMFGNHITADLFKASLPFLIVNGVFIFGLEKIFFLEAINRISVTKTLALGSGAPFITLIFAWIIFHEVPTFWQVASLIPLTLGVLLLTNNLKLKKEPIPVS